MTVMTMHFETVNDVVDRREIYLLVLPYCRLALCVMKLLVMMAISVRTVG